MVKIPFYQVNFEFDLYFVRSVKKVETNIILFINFCSFIEHYILNITQIKKYKILNIFLYRLQSTMPFKFTSFFTFISIPTLKELRG